VRQATLIGPGGFRKPVALKILHDGTQSLSREARIGGLLRHRHLVDVYEIGEADGQWFCAMEMCAGGTLADHMPLPQSAVVQVGLQVCRALHYAHSALGLIHLDLKPNNLLLTEHGEVKVADLGIARAKGFEGDGGIRGTPGYMAPEQSYGEWVDARADIYALGVTLIELATGAGPRASGTMAFETGEGNAVRETINLDSQQPVADRSDTSQPIPEWLAAVVTRCLDPDPGQRWPDMAALAAALESLTPTGAGLREHLGLHKRVFAPQTRPRTNLEPDSDAFVGRLSELETLAEHFAEAGLYTLRGPPGIGKSRLATVAAQAWLDGGNGQAWRCELSTTHDLGGLHRVVAQALNIPLGRHDSTAQLGWALASHGPLVLVLDNFEQLTEQAHVVSTWMEKAPLARLVVTSRTPLGVLGERIVEVDALDPKTSLALLANRAAQRGADLSADPDAEALAARLDGLPLALELAAGRLGVLSASDVLVRLGQGILRSTDEGRHSTLQAALDCSWALLSPSDQLALAQLAVFSGGFSLEAAEAVLELPDDESAVDAVASLEAQSMVRSDGQRFELLSTVRAFARAKNALAVGGSQRRHGIYFAQFGEDSAIEALDAHGGTALRQQLSADLDNVVSACRTAVERSHGAVAAQTIKAAWALMKLRGPYPMAISLADQVLSVPTLTHTQRATVSLVAADATRLVGGRDAALARYQASLDLFRDAGDRRGEGVTRRSLGGLHRDVGKLAQAREHYEVALRLAIQVEDQRLEALTVGALGLLDSDQGRFEEAAARFQRSLDMHRALGNRHGEGMVLSNLSNLQVNMGEAEAASRTYESALLLKRELGDVRGESVVLGNMGLLDQSLGYTAEALARYEASLELKRALGARRGEGIVLGNLGILHRAEGRLAQARSRLEAALAMHREFGNRRHEGIVLGHLGLLQSAQGAHDEARSLLEQAQLLAAAVGDVRFEGFWLGELARVVGGTVALELLDRGEALLRNVGGTGVLTALLTARVEVHWRLGDRAAALAALAEAEASTPPQSVEASGYVERVKALMTY
jgi:predicted ATPase